MEDHSKDKYLNPSRSVDSFSGILVHNFYRSTFPSGENDAVLKYEAILKSICERSTSMFAHSDWIAEMSLTEKLEMLLNKRGQGKGIMQMRNIMSGGNYDFLNFHNLFPYYGSGILNLAKRNNIKLIYSVHNYKFRCLAGSNFRSGQICQKCNNDTLFTNGIMRACFQESKLNSWALSRKIRDLRNMLNQIDAFIVLSTHAAKALEEIGVSENRIYIDRTFSQDPKYIKTYVKNVVLFVGRIDELKGILPFISAWERSSLPVKGWQLRIAGSGPLVDELRAKIEGNESIIYLGKLDEDRLNVEYSQCKYVSIPSRGFEGFPQVASEALSFGKPILSSNLGSLPTILSKDFTVFMNLNLSDQVFALDSLPSLDFEAMSVAARNYWRANLNLEDRIQKMKELFETILKR